MARGGPMYMVIRKYTKVCPCSCSRHDVTIAFAMIAPWIYAGRRSGIKSRVLYEEQQRHEAKHLRNIFHRSDLLDTAYAYGHCDAAKRS